MKIYLAGPMTGLPEFNFPAFHAAAADLRALGHVVSSPAELPPDIGTDRPWSFYMRRGLGMLLECEAIVLLSGWAESRGASLELTVAKALGMQCGHYYSQRDAKVCWWEGAAA